MTDLIETNLVKAIENIEEALKALEAHTLDYEVYELSDGTAKELHKLLGDADKKLCEIAEFYKLKA